MASPSESSAQSFLDSLRVESTFNQDQNKPPFALWCPAMKGKLIWLCAKDEDGKITSVHQFAGNEEEPAGRHVAYIENDVKAKAMRDELMEQGWQKLSPPKVVFRMGDAETSPEIRSTK